MSYTIPTTSYSDNGTKYYAVMTIDNGDGNKSTITTNQAYLNVIADDKPSIVVDNSIFNHSHNDHNVENTILNSVAKGDNLTYKINITDVNTNSALVAGIIGLKIPRTMEISDVRVDGQTIAGENVSLIADPNNEIGNILIMNNIDFSKVKSHTLEIDGTVGDFDNPRFTSTVEMAGLNSAGDDIINFESSQILELNFANGILSLTANDWQYQTINSFGTDSLINRKEMVGNAVDISDNRRQKKPTKLYLSQVAPFKAGENILNSEVRYYQANGSYSTLDDNGTLVSQTEEGDTVQSISWNHNEGPLLYLNSGYQAAGNYSTDLEWSLVESI